jgi:hypothetical protein
MPTPKHMRTSHIFLLGLTMAMPAVCHAQAKCPWINEATASGILGGDVTLSATVSDRGEGVCEFSRHHQDVVYQLRISVNIMSDIAKEFPTYIAQCPPKTNPLPAVGNEAVMCSIQGKGGTSAEMVVGRVRDQAFVVSISSSLQEDPSMTQEMRREKANRVAEQVAGILF